MIKQPQVSIEIIFKNDNNYTFESVTHCLNLDHDNYEILLLPDKKITERLQQLIAPHGS